MSQKHAEAAGMPVYQGPQPGIVVCAAKVKTLGPSELMPGAVRVEFDDFASGMDLQPKWVQQNLPQVGGYIVIPEGGGAGFTHAQQFEKEFSRIAEEE